MDRSNPGDPLKDALAPAPPAPAPAETKTQEQITAEELAAAQAAEAAPAADAAPEAEVKAAIAEVGLSYEAIAEEYDSETGITPETKEKLAKVAKQVFGVSDAEAAVVVEQYFDGIALSREKIAATLLEDVGGQEGYQKLLAWARTALPAADAEAYDKSLVDAGSDVAKAKAAVNALNAKYVAAVGAPSKLQTGATTPTQPITPIMSRAELREVMRSERYQKDPAFRAFVDQRARLGMESGRYIQN